MPISPIRTTVNSFVEVRQALQQISRYLPADIPDPGHAGAINATSSGVCNMTTTAAAETRTLAIPEFAGQWIDLCCDTTVAAGTDTIVVTVASSFLATSKTVLTFTKAGTYFHLRACTVAGVLVWRSPMREITAADFADET